jgi:hypothetical protein
MNRLLYVSCVDAVGVNVCSAAHAAAASFAVDSR